MTLNNEGDAKKVPQETEEIITLVQQYLKLEAIDKVSVAATFLIVDGVILIFGISAVHFLSTGLVKSLSAWIGDETTAYYLMGGILLLIIIVFYLMRKTLVEGPIVRSISQSILKEDEEDGTEE